MDIFSSLKEKKLVYNINCSRLYYIKHKYLDISLTEVV